MRFLTVLFVAMLALSSCSSAETTDDFKYGSPTVSGAALLILDTAGDSEIGSVIPAVAGQGFEGDSVNIDPNDGRAKVIVFLAHWCPHCQDEVPLIVDWIDQNSLPEGVDVIGVVTGTQPGQPNYPPNAWLDREGWNALVVVDDAAGSIAANFGLSAYPFFVIVDAEGRVIERSAGGRSAEGVAAAIELAAGS